MVRDLFKKYQITVLQKVEYQLFIQIKSDFLKY